MFKLLYFIYCSNIMLKLQLHFVFMIIIIVLSAINAFYVIYSEDTSIFFKFLSIILIFLLIYISNFKETFLPFLGNTVYPISLIPSAIHPQNSNFSTEVNLNYPNGTKVIYWAANGNGNNRGNGSDNDSDKNTVIKNPKDAYGNYINSGVSIINNKKTLLHLNCPDKYKIPSGIILNKHIHYRIAIPNNPILSDVKTMYIKC
jgi:hypothetical protein